MFGTPQGPFNFNNFRASCWEINLRMSDLTNLYLKKSFLVQVLRKTHGVFISAVSTKHKYQDDGKENECINFKFVSI